jgi:multicomponent Na+:H+ antiporter subunit F
MSPWLLAVMLLLAGGLAPALLLASRADAVSRLIGLELAGPVSVAVLLLLIRSNQQTSALILPLVLALLSFAGALVFTRLLRSS